MSHISRRYKLAYLRQKADRKKQRDYMPLIVTIAFVTILIAMGVTFFTDHSSQTLLKVLSPEKMSDGWVLDGTSICLPYHLAKSNRDTYTITNTLGEVGDGDAILISLPNSSYEVWIGGRQRTPNGLILDLDASDSGRQIRIVISPDNTRSYMVPAFYIGNYSQLIAWVLACNLWRIGIASMMLVLVIIAAVMEIRRKSEHPEYDRNTMSYFATYVFCVMLWLLSDSNLPRFITGRTEAVQFISCLTLAFAGVPYLAFCAQIFPSGKRVMQWLAALGSVYALMLTVFELTGFREPSQMKIWSYLYLAIIVLADVIVVMRERQTNKYFTKLHIGNVVLLISIFLSLASYSLQPESRTAQAVLAIGFVIFTVIIFDVGRDNQTNIVQESASEASFREMAYLDALTGLHNRAAYNRLLDNIRDRKVKCSDFTIAMLDVNNLKVVNDRLGHQEGDALIKAAAACIQKVFRFRGQCFRIGGDEFAVVMMNSRDKMPFYYERLEQETEEFNQAHRESPWRLVIAMGFAETETKDMPEGIIGMIVQSADNMMYEDKRAKKAAGKCALVGMTPEEAEQLRNQDQQNQENGRRNAG